MGDLPGFLEAVSGALGAWPTVALLLGILALPFITLVAFFSQNLRLGPLAIELRRTARDLDDLSIAMAESRIAELEVAARQVISSLSDKDRRELLSHTENLRTVLARLRAK